MEIPLNVLAAYLKNCDPRERAFVLKAVTGSQIDYQSELFTRDALLLIVYDFLRKEFKQLASTDYSFVWLLEKMRPTLDLAAVRLDTHLEDPDSPPGLSTTIFVVNHDIVSFHIPDVDAEPACYRPLTLEVLKQYDRPTYFTATLFPESFLLYIRPRLERTPDAAHAPAPAG